MQAIVNVPVCPLKASPDARSLEDEVLLGMPVELTGP